MFFGSSKLLGRGAVALVAAAVAVVLPAGDQVAARTAPRVVATTTVVADLVRQVAGDRVEIDCLMGPGVDPHSYRATPADAERLARADIVVAAGLHLEGKLAAILERMARTARVVTLADAVPQTRLIEAGDGVPDPHIWFDARLWSLCVPAVVEPLAAIDPAGRATFQQNAADFVARLEKLDDTSRTRIATIPAERRVMITAHDAFRYFGRAYGLDVLGVQGVSTESEAGLNDINRLVETVVARKLPAVFVETSVAERNVRAIQEGARARGHEVAVGGALYSDSLGGPGSGAETLEAALARNVETIVTGLGGR